MAVRLDPLAGLAAEYNSSLASSGDPGADTLAQQIPLKLSQCGHKRRDELSLSSAQIELQAGLSNQGDVPGLQVLQRMEQVAHRAAPAGELGDEDNIDLACLGERKDFFALGAVLRVRPKAMTVAVIVAGLVPILLGSGTGSEVMQRIAAPMVGGMITAPLLSMFVVPAVYLLLRRAERARFNRRA